MATVLLMPAVEKYLRKVREKPLLDAFQKALLILADDPSVGEAKLGNLTGILTYAFTYAKTNYRLAYIVREENGQTVVVLLAGTRENFYEELKRHMQL